MIELHSSNANADGRRWGHMPSTATHTLICDSRTGIATLRGNDRIERSWDNPFAALAWMESFQLDWDRDSRWVGFISYDLGRLIEKLPAIATGDLNLPLFAFTFHRSSCGYSEVEQSPRRMVDQPLRSNFTRAGYIEAVKRIVEYIRAGDVFQVNLAQRFTSGLSMQPAEIWKRLKQFTPATYGAYLDFGEFALICNSPELFLRVSPDISGRRRVQTRPIKGTRPRLPGMEIELCDSLKDQAELNMIVDLERNDLGRVCEIGSVRVVEPRRIEAHPTIYHGVAEIEGILRADITFPDLLRATFPGGSITGAPKIRAMEIIEELEPVRRGAYCGAIGYIAADGTMEFNIAIRTMIAKDGIIHIPVGGGIVADSDPAAEYEETLVKAKAMFNALGIEHG